MKKFSFIAVLLFFAVSCNKEQRFSNRLQKGERWSVESITVNGTATEGNLGRWDIKTDVNIAEEVPTLSWSRGNESSLCEWQFQEDGKKFQLNYYQLCEECDGNLVDSLDYDVYNLTGNYTVGRKNRKRMQFSSNTTIGYPNQTVVIEIERQ
jgi:hypothetical protein